MLLFGPYSSFCLYALNRIICPICPNPPFPVCGLVPSCLWPCSADGSRSVRPAYKPRTPHEKWYPPPDPRALPSGARSLDISDNSATMELSWKLKAKKGMACFSTNTIIQSAQPISGCFPDRRGAISLGRWSESVHVSGPLALGILQIVYTP